MRLVELVRLGWRSREAPAVTALGPSAQLPPSANLFGRSTVPSVRLGSTFASPGECVEKKDLVARVLAGDPQAERELYDANVDRVYRLVYRMVGDSELASDYTQDTFIRAFERLSSFRGESALSTWITAI